MILGDGRAWKGNGTLRILTGVALLSLSFSLRAGNDLQPNIEQPLTGLANPEEQFTPMGPTQPLGFKLDSNVVKERLHKLLASTQNNPAESNPEAKKHPKQAEANKQGPRFASRDAVINPAAFVSLGDSSPAYGILVEKLHSRLTLYERTASDSYRILKTYHAVTGKDPEDKQTTGDLRTPEGIYFVTGVLHDDDLPAKYGRMALTLDYPNVFDRRKRKSGYGIWIHATDDPSRLDRPFDTEGCVAVSNDDVLELSKYAVRFETPVVIVKEMPAADADELSQSQQRALAMIEAWRSAWEASDFGLYTDFYSADFVSLGKTRKDWISFKKNLSKSRRGQIQVKISKPKILAFEDQLLVVFLQDYKSPYKSDFGRKFIYLKWEGDRYRIIAEKWYPTERKADLVTRVTGSL